MGAITPFEFLTNSSISNLMALNIRPVEPHDFVELAELLNAIIRAGGTTALEEEYTPEALGEAYLIGPSVLFCHVAEDDATGRLEGFQTMGLYPGLPDGYGNIATFSRMDGVQRGVGSALFRMTLKTAKAHGLSGINATIRADNTGGLVYYSKMGFTDFSVDEAVPLGDSTPVDRVNKRLAI